MALSKLKASLMSATSEMTLAAANLNLDISIFKFEAPPAAYEPFGKALSSKRKDEAEYGTIHTTARKLGQLFLQTLPPIPRLIEAYGTRVSEISTSAKVNPQGKSIDGLFSGQVGADGTTIWAAATSGPGAVPVHLLACMLARTWTAPQAVSIWVEIVDERKREIAEEFEKGNASYLPTLQATQHEIRRDHLAEWDASARAWLRSADAELKAKVDRLRVVVTDLNLPIDDSDIPYKSVMAAWKSAMLTMENLLSGQPQTIYRGSALVGLSAWHVFPDLIVIGGDVEYVRFDDPLIHVGGDLTIGLHYESNPQLPSETGVHWSLSLAHLKFYGAPVRATSSLEHDNQRLYFEEFACVALGAITHILNCTVKEAAGFFSACIDQVSGSTKPVQSAFRQPDEAHKYRVSGFLNRHGRWFNVLNHASRMVLESTDWDAKRVQMLTNCGARHGRAFFCEPSNEFGRLFGICDVENLLQLLPNSNLRINMLRSIVDRLQHEDDQLLIRYKAKSGPLSDRPADEHHAVVWEFATAWPKKQVSVDSSGNSAKVTFRHKRWVQIDVLRHARPCNCKSSCVDCGCLGKCMIACHPQDIRSHCGADTDLLRSQLRDWVDYVTDLGEDAEVILDPWTAYSRSNGNKVVEPRSRPEEFFFVLEPGTKPIRYLLVVGDPRRAAIYMPSHLTRREVPKSSSSAESKLGGLPNSAEYNEALTVEDINLFLRRNEVSAHQLLDVLRQQDEAASRKADTGISEAYAQFFKSLRGIGMVANIYRMLPSATVAIKAISLPFHASLWIPSSSDHSISEPPSLSRPQTFACVAMMDSGHLNLEPSLLEEVFALSSVDSIYVSSFLLCDPYDRPQEFELRRVVGNVGRAGMAMLIPPQSPEIKQPNIESWNLVPHADFDGEAVDSFASTSMHLSFSGYTLPLQTGFHGRQDVDAYLLESVVKVCDRGKWVADLNVLQALTSDPELLDRHPLTRFCSHTPNYDPSMRLTAIDSWDELVQAPGQLAVIRANGNWLARLAVTCVAAHTGCAVYILQSDFCWKCAVRLAQTKDRSSLIQQILEQRSLPLTSEPATSPVSDIPKEEWSEAESTNDIQMRPTKRARLTCDNHAVGLRSRNVSEARSLKSRGSTPVLGVRSSSRDEESDPGSPFNPLLFASKGAKSYTESAQRQFVMVF